MRLAVLALCGVLASAPAFACNDLSASAGASCAQWAPLSGDVEADRCTIARLDADRAIAAIGAQRAPQRAGEPAWSRAFLIANLRDARARMVRACAQH